MDLKPRVGNFGNNMLWLREYTTRFLIKLYCRYIYIAILSAILFLACCLFNKSVNVDKRLIHSLEMKRRAHQRPDNSKVPL